MKPYNDSGKMDRDAILAAQVTTPVHGQLLRAVSVRRPYASMPEIVLIDARNESSQPARERLYLFTRGIRIEAYYGHGGAVNLAVRRQHQHKGLWRRLRQLLAHALFRAGDIVYQGHAHNALRVMHGHLGDAPPNDLTPNVRHLDAREVWPFPGGDAPDSKAHYLPNAAHECSASGYDGRPIWRASAKGNQCAANACGHLRPLDDELLKFAAEHTSLLKDPGEENGGRA